MTGRILTSLLSIRTAATLLSVALLCGAAWEKASLAPPPDAARYHARVRIAAQAVAQDSGAWIGKDVPLPGEAMDMLQPNALISRCYKSQGRTVWFLMVQCQDLKLLDNHYPPHCYPAMGYSKLSEKPCDWNVAGKRVTGMEYEFARVAFDPSTSIVVENFMVLPRIGIVRDMDPVSDAASDVRRRKYGGAEFQVLFEPGTYADERLRIVQQLLAPCLQLIDEIGSDPN